MCRVLQEVCQVISKPWPIMLNFLPIMLLNNAQKFAYYAQYCAHDYCNYATVCTHMILLFLMNRLA